MDDKNNDQDALLKLAEMESDRQLQHLNKPPSGLGKVKIFFAEEIVLQLMDGQKELNDEFKKKMAERKNRPPPYISFYDIIMTPVKIVIPIF